MFREKKMIEISIIGIHYTYTQIRVKYQHDTPFWNYTFIKPF